jgi:hypothetical protein
VAPRPTLSTTVAAGTHGAAVSWTRFCENATLCCRIVSRALCEVRGGRVKKVAHLLRRFEFHVLLCCLGLVAFGKPTLIPGPDTAPAAVMLAYFVPWLLLIAVLFAIAHSGTDPAEEEDQNGDATTAEPAQRE